MRHLLALGLLLFGSTAWAESPIYSVPIDGDAVQGPPDAPVTIVEFTELACPYCAKVRPTLAGLVKRYGGKIRIVYKPFVVHPMAMQGASALCAAQKQGRFEAFEDLAWNAVWDLSNPADVKPRGDARTLLSEPSLIGLASQAHLDVKQFTHDMNDGPCKLLPVEYTSKFKSIGVQGVPAFFINGRSLTGAQPLETFVTVIDEELAKASSSGIKPSEYYQREVVAKGQTEVTAKLPAEKPEPKRPARPMPDSTSVYAVPIDGFPMRGPDKADITIVELDDLASPFGYKVQATLHDLETRYAGQIRFVFVPFLVHPQTATLAAQILCAADKEQKFWPLQQAIWKAVWGDGYKPDQLERPALVALAAKMGLPSKRLEANMQWAGCADQPSRAQRDIIIPFGVSGTPSFFINGRFLSGAQPLENFVKIIDEELPKVGSDPNYYRNEVLGKGKTKL